MNKEEALKHFGLNDIEINVYLELLRLGSTKVNALAKKARLPRTSAYNVLDSLVAKGLVSYVIKSGVKYFDAANPESLLAILKEKEKYLESVLPELEKIRGTVKEKPKIEVYEGKEGIKAVMNDLLRTRKPVLSFSSTKHIFDLLEFYTPQFIRQRVKAGIEIRLLTEKTKETEETLKNKDKKELRETRYLPKIGNIPNTVYVYGNKVALLNTNPDSPMGVLIENVEIANTQRLLFEIIWEKAK